MRIFQNKSTRALILIMLALVVVALVVAKTYYSKQNGSVDPRVVRARELYAKYDSYAFKGEFQEIFPLLDSIENEYLAIKHYSKSYEPGVLYNNRAAALLTLALYSDSIPAERNPYADLSSDSLVTMAERELVTVIECYKSWLKRYEDKTAEEIKDMIRDEFIIGLGEPDSASIEKYLDVRVKEIEKAFEENKRRLSVSYTNMGVVRRYREDYESALDYYAMALELWDRNLDAENNINRLLGKPLKKRNIIQKLFPPEK